MEEYLKYYTPAKRNVKNNGQKIYRGIPEESVLPPLPDVKPPRYVTDVFGKLVIMKENLYMDPELFYYTELDEETPLCLDWFRYNSNYKCCLYRKANTLTNEARNTGSIYGKRKYSFKNNLLEEPRFPSSQWFDWLSNNYGNVKWVPSQTANITPANNNGDQGIATQALIERRKSISYSWEYFFTNLLLYIFEFVKNDSVVAVSFDRSLLALEASCIKYVVNCVVKIDAMYEYFNQKWQLDMIRFVQNHNIYMLSTGIQDGQIYLLKIAPPTIYLVLPSDIDTNESDVVAHNSHIIQYLKEEERKRKSDPKRPFVREYNYLVAGIVQYFIDFVSKDYFSELRFHGQFKPEHAKAISTFAALLLGNTSTYGDMYKDLQDQVGCLLGNDVCQYVVVDHSNENYVIMKEKKLTI